MIKLYGSKLWSGCTAPKEVLSKKGVDFVYLDITENLMYMKQFLKIRDTSSQFDAIRGGSSIGIPCIDNDGEIHLTDMEEFLESL